MDQLEREVQGVFEARRQAAAERARIDEENLQAHLERWRNDLMNGKIWPKCGSERCVRAVLAKDMTVACPKCGAWWNF